MNMIDSKSSVQDTHLRLRNPRKLECTRKPVADFPHPALASISF
jgi:hypothetical protein